jgi:spore maturation protein SpmA
VRKGIRRPVTNWKLRSKQSGDIAEWELAICLVSNVVALVRETCQRVQDGKSRIGIAYDILIQLAKVAALNLGLNNLAVYAMTVQNISASSFHLCRAAEDLVPPADTWTHFVVLCFRMTRGVKLGLKVDMNELGLKAHRCERKLTRSARSEPPNHTA